MSYPLCIMVRMAKVLGYRRKNIMRNKDSKEA